MPTAMPTGNEKEAACCAHGALLTPDRTGPSNGAASAAIECGRSAYGVVVDFALTPCRRRAGNPARVVSGSRPGAVSAAWGRRTAAHRCRRRSCRTRRARPAELRKRCGNPIRIGAAQAFDDEGAGGELVLRRGSSSRPYRSGVCFAAAAHSCTRATPVSAARSSTSLAGARRRRHLLRRRAGRPRASR